MKKETITVFLPSLHGGGAERVMVTLANGFNARGLAVELVLARAEGPYLEEVVDGVKIIDLHAGRVATSLPRLFRYLRQSKPTVLLSTHSHANVIALWASRLAGSKTRVVVRETNTSSVSSRNSRRLRDRAMPVLIRRFYPWADAVIAPSKGALKDLIQSKVVSPEQGSVVYSPAVTRSVFEMAAQTLDHPWFNPKTLPVVMTAGRLTKQKDFGCLVRAFSQAAQQRAMRLIVLGEGEERQKLERMAFELGMEKNIAFPGFVKNPFNYMKRADLFVLSSAWEGLPNVLIQAMACGTPVVATDCPSGPAEILNNGRFGPLVPVGSVDAMVAAILGTIGKKSNRAYCERLISKSKRFSEDVIVDQYLDVLLRKRKSEPDEIEGQNRTTAENSRHTTS